MVETVASLEIGSWVALLLHHCEQYGDENEVICNGCLVGDLLTWLSIGFAHDELLLDESLVIDGSVSLLFGAILGHVLISSSEEFGGVLLHALFVVLRLPSAVITKIFRGLT